MESVPYIFEKDGMVVACYVDDILVLALQEDKIENSKDCLGARFVLKDSSPPKHFFRTELLWVEYNKVGLRRSNLIGKLLAGHRTERTKATTIPMTSTNDIPNGTKMMADGERGKYISIIGRPLNIALKTRPDISTARVFLKHWYQGLKGNNILLPAKCSAIYEVLIIIY